MKGELLVLLLASGLGPALGVALGEPLEPDSIFYQQDPATGDMYVLCRQGVELAGQLVGTADASSPVECGQACRDNAECDIFNYLECANVQSGACDECKLYALNCTIAPVAVAPPAGDLPAAITTGFPVRYDLSAVPGFTAQAGQGVPGADIACPQSLIPGKCALGSIADAIITCVRLPDCQAVVHYFRGTDGCSKPVSLLTHDVLTQGGAFMSPLVATLSRVDNGNLLATTLLASDGEVLEAPAGQLPPAGLPAGSNTTWLGCIVADNALMAGSIVDTLDGLPSAEDCCRACRNNTGCNLYNYCGLEGGCSYTRGPRTRQLDDGQCELLYSETVGPPLWFPPAVIAKGPSVPFIGGAPLVLSAPPLPGYSELPGTNQFAFTGGSFNCSFTELPQSGECAVFGTLEQVAGVCNETQECAGMIISPGKDPGTVRANLKTLINSSSAGLSPSNGLYLKSGVPINQPAAQPSSSGSSLSTAAIVGIALGAAAAAAGVAAAWLQLHRRRSLRTGSADAAKDSEDEVMKAAGGSGTAGSTCSDVIVLGLDDSHTRASASSAPHSGGTGVSAGSGSNGALAATAPVAAEGGAARREAHPADGPAGPSRDVSGVAAAAAGRPSGASSGRAWSGVVERTVAHPAGLRPGQRGGGMQFASPFSGGPRSGRASLDNWHAGSSPAASPFARGPGSARASLDAAQYGKGGGAAGAHASPFAAGGASPASAFAGAASAPTSSGTDDGAPATPAVNVTVERTAAVSRSRLVTSPFAAARARAAAAAGVSGGPSRTSSGTPSAMGTPAASSVASPAAMARVSGAALREAQPSRQPSAQPSVQPSERPSMQPSTTSSRGGLASTSTSTAGSRELLELAAHVAECDAAMSFAGDSVGGPLVREHSLIQAGSLPSSLRDLIVDIEDIEFLTWPNGAPMELGSGASATVYKVMFRGEVVAAKEVDLGRSPAVQQLFVQEAERLHQLRHAHVVTLYGVALSGSRGIILMEYCSGRDLHSAMQLRISGTQRRLFGWYARGRHVAVDIAKGLNFLHSKGCVHMDIKSSNVLLTGSGTAKLADIGLARLQQGTHLSDMPRACGTFAWMAPEVIMGSRCTTAVDIFSFGVVLWELITGETPKRGEMRLPEVPSECPQEAADLVTRCMSLEPSDRPTAQQLMQQLAAMKALPGGQGSGSRLA